MKEKLIKFFKGLYDFIQPKLHTIGAVLLAFLTIVVVHALYKHFFGNHLVVEFKALAPIEKSMPVYYKGFKIGKTGKIQPSSDFTSSGVKIILDKNLHKMPDNVIASIKKMGSESDKNVSITYLDLEYPEIPSTSFIKRGAVIEGKTATDIQSFMNSQASSGQLTIISNNMGKTLESAEKTSDEIRGLVSDIRDTLKENRPNILAITTNFKSITNNFDGITKNVNTATESLSTAMHNVNNITANIDKATRDLDKSKARVDKALDNVVNATANVTDATGNITDATANVVDATANVNQITVGLKETLSKRFGFSKVVFGTPMSKNSTSSTCTKANAAAPASAQPSAPGTSGAAPSVPSAPSSPCCPNYTTHPDAPCSLDDVMLYPKVKQPKAPPKSKK